MKLLLAVLVVCASLVSASAAQAPVSPLEADLDGIFAAPVLARALVGIRVDSLATGKTLYARNANKLVMPASNMKLLTMATAAERLGWNFTYTTRLEAAGQIQDGVLHGNLIVVGGGDPTIASQDFGPAPLFAEWAAALRAAGIRRVEGRLVGDDRAFDRRTLGDGWAWDYLADGYASPIGALTYNENAAVVRAWPGQAPGDPVRIEVTPPGHELQVINEMKTGAADSPRSLDLSRLPATHTLTVRGSLPAGGRVIVQTASVDDPTRFFVEAFRLALADQGITVAGHSGFGDETDVARTIATRTSPPLSAFAGYFLKTSQNLYGETLLKTLGRAGTAAGTTAGGRAVVRDTLAAWGITPDAFVMYDGSGLSRYNYVTADTIVTILEHVWADERLRGPFVALLPVAGHDGTLENRMKKTALDGRLEAKTGTIANVRSLSGYLETKSGERLVFSMIANHFTAPASEIDAVVEKALLRLMER
jgi:D-alanyl-D-alanine carboxypeptidase/D-alanyl-D-alanine-endopeptidase (penicillin-binding protein 4)